MPGSTQIRVECRDCGVVRVTMPDLTLRMCVETECWSYCFRCPLCGLANGRDSVGGAVATLVAIGAQVERWNLPAELREVRIDGPSFTLDDVLDLHLLLEQPDWFNLVVGERTETGG